MQTISGRSKRIKRRERWLRKNDGTLYGDYNTSRKYWCRGNSVGFTPSVNSEKTQSGAEEKTDDDRDR